MKGFGFTICMVATIGLLIAKFGFGVQIGLLWVFAPLWFPLALYLTVLLVLFLVAMLASWIAGMTTKSRIAARKRRLVKL